MKNQFLFLTLSLFLFAACKKDETTINQAPETPEEAEIIDTLTPLSYFPAYPGSHWTYVDLNGDTTVSSTAPEYQLDSYEVYFPGEYTDTKYVPFYDGTPIWGYEKHTGLVSNAGTYPFQKFVSETAAVGENWLIYNWQGNVSRNKIIAKDTTINVLGQDYYPTIVVETYSQTGMGNVRTDVVYYTKDIGIVRKDIYTFDFQNMQSILSNTKLLNEYFINH